MNEIELNYWHLGCNDAHDGRSRDVSYLDDNLRDAYEKGRDWYLDLEADLSGRCS